MTKLVQGVVQRISIKPIANGPDRFDNNFRRSFQIDDVWYSMGGCKTDKWNVKIGNDFKVLGVGSTVAFKAEQSGDFWNGKSLMILELVEGSDAKPAQQASNGDKPAYTPKPKDSTGVSTGHSFNGAMNYILAHGLTNSNEFIVETAKKVHNVTERVKAEYAKANPDMSAYDSGAAAGNSVLNACKLLDSETEDFETDLHYLAMDFLNNVVPKIMAHVKGETKQPPAPPAKVSRATAKPKAPTKAVPVKDTPAMPLLSDSGGFEDMDGDIPFANPLKRSGLHLVM